jgi:cohesin complex subunit SA-1/2
MDPNIRAECVHAIGLWFKKYPEHFVDGAFLRYVGWVLSDSNTHVRLEAVKSLSGVYEQSDFISSLNHFTERFKPRLIEMATSDTELSIRVAVIQVLGAVDGHSLLEDEERQKLCLLVFDGEPKVRKAVSQFVKSVWEECVEERLVGRSRPNSVDRERAGVKAITMLLVKWGRILDKITGNAEDGSIADDEGRDEDGTSQSLKKREIAALATLDQKGRIALAVEALWDEVDSIRDWETLLQLLLLDHSATDDESQSGSSRRQANGSAHNPDSAVDEAWRLEEVEESLLLEIFVTVLRQAKAEAAAAKKVCLHCVE